jgi:ATP-dependent Clp protease adaptor protein ClpS
MFILSSSIGETREQVLTDRRSQTEPQHDLIVYNDDVNSFDFVIDCFIEICEHDKIQAEQCTHLVHYKGKCAVKRGSFKELEAVCTALLDRGLTAEIE